jgi:hypothetical protein
MDDREHRRTAKPEEQADQVKAEQLSAQRRKIGAMRGHLLAWSIRAGAMAESEDREELRKLVSEAAHHADGAARALWSIARELGLTPVASPR